MIAILDTLFNSSLRELKLKNIKFLLGVKI